MPAELIPCQFAISVEALVMAGVSPWLGEATGLSSGQVQVRLNRRFEAGTAVMLGIDDGSGSPQTMLARVTAIDTADSGWLLTCHLARPLDADELASLLQPPARPVPRPETVPEIASEAIRPTHVDLRSIRERLGKLRKP
jgi:hypothetical protein